jgi:hypothetical protein
VPFEHYRIRRAIPSRLDYPTASYVLEIVKQRHEVIPVDEWVFRARKVNAQTVCVILTALAHRSHLLERLADGFDVEIGTPAAKLMDRLVRDGIAEKARPGRR